MKLNYLLIPYLAVLAFMLSGILNSGGIAWYLTLTLPSWNPPVTAIAIMWAVIYVCATWSLLIVWNKLPHDTNFKIILGGFALSTVLNLAWSVVFFRVHLLDASEWLALALGFSLLWLMSRIYLQSKKAALLLLPYTLWVFVAAYLCYQVMVLNS